MNTIENASVLEDLGLTPSAQTKSGDGLGQEDFLTLMTAQLKNQDPLKPMENGEFLGQLAQFSSVTGIQDLQSSFQSLANSLYSNQTLQVANMVGREVLVPNRYSELGQDGQLTGAVDLPNAVANLNIGVYDISGQLVRKIDHGPQSAGLAHFSWDGLTAEGEIAPPGQYEVRAEALNGEINEQYDVLMATRVESVTLPQGGGAPALELAGVGQVDFTDIRQIR